MFLEYLRCDGKWMESNLVVKQVTSKGQLVEGVERYMRYMDLKKKEGAVTAKLIRDEKRVLQEQLEKNPDPDVLPFIMAHPDLPGSEDSCGYTSTYIVHVLVLCIINYNVAVDSYEV